MEAIENLNNAIELREKMINKIMYSKEFKTAKSYDKFEESLNKKSFAQLKKLATNGNVNI